MRGFYNFLFAGIAFASLLYLAGCNKDNPSVNTVPVFGEESYTFTIAEDVASGAAVGTVVVTDADGDNLTYRITTTQTDFEISETGAVITVSRSAALDFETTLSYDIEVQVSDGTNTAAAKVTVNVSDVNEAPVFANTPYAFGVDLGADRGATVGLVYATDEDGDTTLTYMLSGDGAAHFAISHTPVPSGEEVPITVATGTDLFSLASPVAVTVTVTDGSHTTTAEVVVTIRNVAPVFANTPYAFEIAEDAVSGATVDTVSATDSNMGDMLSYALSGDGAAHFAISHMPVASGEEVPVTVATGTNLSLLASPVTVVVMVTDGSNTATTEAVVTISNVVPVFANTPYAFEIAEDAVSGATVGLVSATDSNVDDMLSYALSGDGAAHFAISNMPVASGEEVPVAVATGADLSSLANPVTIMVTATDGGTPALTATTEVVVTIGNAAPMLANTPYTFKIDEYAVSGATVGLVSATDSNEGDMLSYTLSGDNAAHFATSHTPVASGVEVPVTVATDASLSSLDSPVTIMVTVADEGTPVLTDTAEVVVIVNVTPMFNTDHTFHTFEIDENAESGDMVGTVAATDEDGDVLEYTTTTTQTTFDVGASTGIVTVAESAALDFETTTSHTLKVRVSDGTNEAIANVVVNVGDVNDEVPEFVNTPYTFKIDEDIASGATVGIVVATDADAGTTLAYSITTSQTDFDMGASTGLLTVAKSAALDFETTASYTLEVQASDGTYKTTANVAVNVGNTNENAPAFANTPYIFETVENAASGYVVGTVVATDADAGTTLAYSITTSQTDFDMGASTGLLTVAKSAALDFETTASYTLEVQASDGTYKTTANVAVNVSDVNDAPMFTQTSYIFAVEVGATAGSVATGTALFATDPDVGDMANLTYSLVGINDQFEVATDGTITVKTGAMIGEMGNTFVLEVQVSDNAMPPLTDRATATVTVGLINYDSDNDRLIDVTTLEQLNAIRWDLDGDGVPVAESAAAYAAAFPNAAPFPTEDDAKPIGYELMRSLDFDEDRSYAGTEADQSWSEGQAGTSGAGWDPIGSYISSTTNTPYTAAFDGNHHTLSNLYINRSTKGGIGLFAVTSATSTVSNLGLVGVAVTGDTSVGSLVGTNNGGTITACYATGTVTGDRDAVGGLVGNAVRDSRIVACYAMVVVTVEYGRAGGLVGRYTDGGAITACYATGNVSGSFRVGGLVGMNSGGGAVTACYATGNVTGTNDIGGLVGWNRGSGSTITACYATGAVTVSSTSTGSEVGGLVGTNESTVTASYFNTETTAQTDDTQGQNTAELQGPIGYTDIYSTWNADIDNGLPRGVDNGQATGDAAVDNPWDFGTDMQYPALKVDFNGDGTATVDEFGTQPRS